MFRSRLVANEFIDTYMAAANGEYVKVYLYVLRHQGEDITIELIADALNHTESDVRRALSYWKKAGVLADSEQEQRVQGEPVRPESGGRTFTREQDREQAAVPDLEVDAFQRKNGTAGRAGCPRADRHPGAGRSPGAHGNRGSGGRLYSGVFHGAG